MSVLSLVLLVAAPPEAVLRFTWDGPEHLEDRCTGMVVGDDGSVFLGGYSMGRLTDFDFQAVMVNPAGETAWTHRYGEPIGIEDRPWAFCAGLDGPVAAGGSIADTVGVWDYFVVAYTGGGDVAWTGRYRFPGHLDDKPAGIAAGPEGDLFVVGSTQRDSGGRRDWDIGLVRLARGGAVRWQRVLDGAGAGDDVASAIAVDDAGNVHIAGRTTVKPPGTDALVAKYDSTGRLEWQRALAGTAPGTDFANGLVLTDDGVVVYGALYGKGTGYDYFAAGFAPDGGPRWQQALDGSGSVDICQAGCLDGQGNLLLTGQSAGHETSVDILTVKLGPGGDVLWTRRWNGAQNQADRGWCIAADARGRVYVGGTTVTDRGYPELVVLAYSAGGELLWEHRDSGTGPGETRPVQLAFDREGRLLVCGHTRSAETGFDYLLLKLRIED